MPAPLFAGALSSLLRRYGLKGLGSAGKGKLKKKAAEKLAAKAGDPNKIEKVAKGLRRKQVAGNVAGDVGTGALVGEAVSSGIDVSKFKTKKELRDYVKENKPKIWAKFTKSDINDIEEFLQSQAG